MKNEDLSYVDACEFMLRYNAHAILRAPSQYLQTVVQSMVSFLWASTYALPFPLRMGFFGLETLAMAIFIGLSLSWLSLHGGRWLWPQTRWLGPHAIDRVLVVFVTIFAYTLLISCAVDSGKSSHRNSVQFLVPLIGFAVLHRLRRPSPVQSERSDPIEQDLAYSIVSGRNHVPQHGGHRNAGLDSPTAGEKVRTDRN